MKRAALLNAIVTFALAYPLTLHPASTVLSDAPDTNLAMRGLALGRPCVRASAVGSVRREHLLPGAPPTRSTFSENLIGSGFIAAPIIWLSGNLVLAMNLVSLLSAVLCGVGTYVRPDVADHR